MKCNFKKALFAVLMLSFGTLQVVAQNIDFYGVKNTMRYDDGDDTKYDYIGWDAATGTAIFKGDVGLWSLDAQGSCIASNLVHYDNRMLGNSGAVYVDGAIYTIFSHENPDAETDGEYEFVVRKWDSKTYEMLSSERFKTSANLESRGMCYNPVDGKVYGLFYLTDVSLPVDDDYQFDEDDIEMGVTSDAGYALCTIDLETMKLTQITPGIYYENFVTLACSPDGRLFSMVSGGYMTEFDPKTGLMVKIGTEVVGGEEYSVFFYDQCGYQSQFKRQAACFDYRTGKMYWNGFINSGKGINDWGSWSNLPDREWRTNGKFDTALYEVDVKTGKATMISKIPNRIAFSCLWVKGGDASDLIPPSSDGIEDVEAVLSEGASVYNAAGQYVGNNFCRLGRGLYIVKKGNVTTKVMKR